MHPFCYNSEPFEGGFICIRNGPSARIVYEYAATLLGISLVVSVHCKVPCIFVAVSQCICIVRNSTKFSKQFREYAYSLLIRIRDIHIHSKHVLIWRKMSSQEDLLEIKSITKVE